MVGPSHRLSRILLIGLFVGSVLGPHSAGRVAIVNDTHETVKLFECNTPRCAGGAVVSIQVLRPDQVTTIYWTDAHDRSVVGVATTGGRLLGCLFDPPSGPGEPPTAGAVVSGAVRCPG